MRCGTECRRLKILGVELQHVGHEMIKDLMNFEQGNVHGFGRQRADSDFV
jgi:hypothetical protein